MFEDVFGAQVQIIVKAIKWSLYNGHAKVGDFLHKKALYEFTTDPSIIRMVFESLYSQKIAGWMVEDEGAYIYFSGNEAWKLSNWIGQVGPKSFPRAVRKLETLSFETLDEQIGLLRQYDDVWHAAIRQSKIFDIVLQGQARKNLQGPLNIVIDRYFKYAEYYMSDTKRRLGSADFLDECIQYLRERDVERASETFRQNMLLVGGLMRDTLPKFVHH